MRGWTTMLGIAVILSACSEQYEQACQQVVLDNRPDYAAASPTFDYELSRTHYFSDQTAQSVTVYYLDLNDRSEARVRVTCYANTDGAFVFAVVKDSILGDRIVDAAAETLARRPRVN